jgi:hypothetical protein
VHLVLVDHEPDALPDEQSLLGLERFEVHRASVLAASNGEKSYTNGKESAFSSEVFAPDAGSARRYRAGTGGADVAGAPESRRALSRPYGAARPAEPADFTGVASPRPPSSTPVLGR